MFELYDMVCVNNNCAEPNLMGRPGLVFGINRAKRSVHVTFDQLNYVVMVPENWLYKSRHSVPTR